MIKPVMSHISENQMSFIIQKRSNSYTITQSPIVQLLPFSAQSVIWLFLRSDQYTILLHTVSSEYIGFQFGVHPLV